MNARLRSGLLILALVVFGISLALVVGEAGLRVAGFEFRTFPTVQFGWPEPEVIANEFTPDFDLFWVTPDYQQKLRSAARAHVEILFLGDSCTQFGTYPRRTLDRLAASGAPVQTGEKLGVAGWSSEQGLAQLRRDVLPLRPRVVTVYFGWNDHWVALGSPDPEARPSRLLWWFNQHSRLAQLVLKVRLGFAGPVTDRPNRVGLERYQANLEAMVREAASVGAATVLITAPANHVEGHEPANLAKRHLRHLNELVPLHRRYVEATRAAAARTGATLCDAAASFEAQPESRTRYFKRDGIHLTEAGDEAMATLLAACITRAAAPR